MIDLKVISNLNGITASLTRFATDQQKAVVRALNKTAEQARTAASPAVRSAGYNIKASAIKKSFAISRASGNSLVVVLKATGAPIGLINYSARQTKSGVGVKVKNGKTILRHAFIGTMSNGHIGVFERVGAAQIKGVTRVVAGRRLRVNKPIKELFGPSIPVALGNAVVEKAIMTLIKEKFPKILAAELNFLLLKG